MYQGQRRSRRPGDRTIIHPKTGHPHLEELQRAVIDRERLRLGYARRNGTRGERVIDPLGLVCKRGVWYLVAGTDAGRRTFRANRVLSVAATGEEAVRPSGFDLEATWRESLDQLDEVRLPLVATVRAPYNLVGSLRAALGTPVEVVGPAGDGGRRLPSAVTTRRRWPASWRVSVAWSGWSETRRA